MKDFFKNGEDVEIAVVVDNLFAVMLKVKVVDHVDVAKIGGGGFVGDVDGMT